MESKNMILICNLFKDKDTIFKIISDAITNETPQIFYINNTSHNYVKLLPGEINDLRMKANYSRSGIKITIRPIKYEHGRYQDLGKFQNVDITDIYAYKEELMAYEINETDNPKLRSKIEAETRYAKYKEVAMQIKKENPSWGQKEIAPEIISRLKSIDKEWVLTPAGTEIDPKSLYKHFKVKTNK